MHIFTIFLSEYCVCFCSKDKKMVNEWKKQIKQESSNVDLEAEKTDFEDDSAEIKNERIYPNLGKSQPSAPPMHSSEAFKE